MFGFSAYAQLPYASTAGAAAPVIVEGVIVESATGLDELVAALSLNALILESSSGEDQISLSSILQGVIAETAIAVDQIGTFEFAEQLLIKLRSFTERRRF